jgi:hypothetical protein
MIFLPAYVFLPRLTDGGQARKAARGQLHQVTVKESP